MRRTLIISGALAALFAASVAFAQTDSSAASSTPHMTVTFPIAELGGCASKDACKAYCDIASHQDACLSFAESHGLMKKEDTDKARVVIKAVGPDGCKGMEACKAYCADTAHQDACIAFASEHGLLKAAEASVVQDIKQNGGPGGCTSPVACRTYCADTTHAAECKAFAESHGIKSVSGQLMPKGNDGKVGSSTEARTAKIDAVLAKTAGPGGCTTADACRTYCADASHQAECVAFAKANGLEVPKPLMASSTMMRPMKQGSTTMAIPPELRQRIASSTDKRGKVIPLDPVHPEPTDGVRATDGGAVPPATASGAGVLWGIMHFFGVK